MLQVHFKLYSKWSALLGFVLSLAATFLNAVSGVVAAMLTVLVSLVVWSKRSELGAILSKQEDARRETRGRGNGVGAGVRSGSERDEMIEEIHDKERRARRRETGYAEICDENATWEEEDVDDENQERRQRMGPSTYIDLLENEERRDESDEDPTAALVEPLLSSSGEEDMFAGAAAMSRSRRHHGREGKKQREEEEMLWDQDEHLVRLASSYVRDALKGR